jgi:broad specificity phosphatase PhoE
MSFKKRSVHFIRHAESVFNEVFHSQRRTVELNSATLIDATLSEKGIQQAKDAERRIAQLDIDLDITSPYTRTLSTCFLAHGNNNVLVTPLCSERFDSICDIGTPKDQLVQQFPDWDFSHVQDNVWWYNPNGLQDLESVIKWFKSSQNTAEPEAVLKNRAEQFYQFLLARPEKNIAVFSHSHFLRKFLHWHFGRGEHYIDNAAVVSFTLP